MAYKRRVETHHNILQQFLPNKRSKEHIESKPQCQKHSNSYHLRKYKISTLKSKFWTKGKKHSHHSHRKKVKIFKSNLERVVGKLPSMLPHFTLSRQRTRKIMQEKEGPGFLPFLFGFLLIFFHFPHFPVKMKINDSLWKLIKRCWGRGP